jgi:hypothetical protein
MDGMRFTVPVYIHGTLSSNAPGFFQLPCAATLVEVSATASNANDATLIVGTKAPTDDDNGLITALAIGDSGVPVVWDGGDFTGALNANGDRYPHLADNTVISWTLDYDGNAGDAAANVSILFTFLEG